MSAQEVVQNIAIWFPMLAFVALAPDHGIANMIFIPIAISLRHPSLTTSYYIWKSMIAILFSNMLSGGIFAGGIYRCLYLTGEGTIDIDFKIGSMNSALELVVLRA